MEAFKLNLEKRRTERGMALFAKATFSKDTVILEFEGMVTNTKPANNYLQIGESTYLTASGGLDDFALHSCNPNTHVYIVGNRAFLKASHLIKAGSEITFDYSLTSTETPEEWSMSCDCGTYGCRKTISGFSALDVTVQKQALAAKLVPSYLQPKQN